MYAYVRSGKDRKQLRVQVGDEIEVELLEKENGEEVVFDTLFVANGEQVFVGAPHVTQFVVKGVLVDTVSGPKVESVKFKPNHNTRRKFGHRQHYSRVRITAIEAV